MRINYSIVFVSDMKLSVAFYRDVVGMPLKFETPEWTEFATEGATFALHTAKGPGTNESIEQKSSAGRCRPGWSVPDLEAFHQKMVEKGVECVEEPKETFGVKLAQYLDPDGLLVSVSEERQ